MKNCVNKFDSDFLMFIFVNPAVIRMRFHGVTISKFRFFDFLQTMLSGSSTTDLFFPDAIYLF